MQCAQSLESLPAYLHHELCPDDERALQDHLAGCSACQHELEVNRAVKRFLRHAVPVEPSAEFRRSLETRIENAVAESGKPDSQSDFWNGGKDRLAVNGPVNSLDDSSDSIRDTPAAEDLVRPRSASRRLEPTTQLSLGKPAKRKSSIRVAAEEKIESYVRGRRVVRVLAFCLLLSLAALWAMYALVLSTENLYPTIALSHPGANRTEVLASERHWEERNVAVMRNAVGKGMIFKNRIPVGDGIVEGESVHVLRQNDPRTNESCLVVYRDADVRSVALDGRVDQAAFASLLKQSIEVQVKDGKCVLPESWVMTCVDTPDAPQVVKLIRLNNRTEVWSSLKLENYLKDGPRFNPLKGAGVAAFMGLPPEK